MCLALTSLLIVADWGQTRYISKNDSYIERNPALGRNPSTKKVDAWFASLLLANGLVLSNIKTKKTREIWCFVVPNAQAGHIQNNSKIGIGASWFF